MLWGVEKSPSWSLLLFWLHKWQGTEDANYIKSLSLKIKIRADVTCSESEWVAVFVRCRQITWNLLDFATTCCPDALGAFAWRFLTRRDCKVNWEKADGFSPCLGNLASAVVVRQEVIHLITAIFFFWGKLWNWLACLAVEEFSLSPNASSKQSLNKDVGYNVR